MTEKGVNIFGGGVQVSGGTGGHVDLKGRILLNVSTAAAAGSVTGDATQLSTGLSLVTAADGTKGVKLPASPMPGELCIVANTNESNTLEIYPGTGDEINGGAADAPFTIAAMGFAICIATSASQWYLAEPAVGVA